MSGAKLEAMKEALCAVSKYLTAWLHARTAGAKNSGGTPVANDNKYRNLFRPSPRRKIKDRLRLSDLLSNRGLSPISSAGVVDNAKS